MWRLIGRLHPQTQLLVKNLQSLPAKQARRAQACHQPQQLQPQLPALLPRSCMPMASRAPPPLPRGVLGEPLESGLLPGVHLQVGGLWGPLGLPQGIPRRCWRPSPWHCLQPLEARAAPKAQR